MLFTPSQLPVIAESRPVDQQERFAVFKHILEFRNKVGSQRSVGPFVVPPRTRQRSKGRGPRAPSTGGPPWKTRTGLRDLHLLPNQETDIGRRTTLPPQTGKRKFVRCCFYWLCSDSTTASPGRSHRRRLRDGLPNGDRVAPREREGHGAERGGGGGDDVRWY